MEDWARDDEPLVESITLGTPNSATQQSGHCCKHREAGKKRKKERKKE